MQIFDLGIACLCFTHYHLEFIWWSQTSNKRHSELAINFNQNHNLLLLFKLPMLLFTLLLLHKIRFYWHKERKKFPLELKIQQTKWVYCNTIIRGIKFRYFSCFFTSREHIKYTLCNKDKERMFLPKRYDTSNMKL